MQPPSANFFRSPICSFPTSTSWQLCRKCPSIPRKPQQPRCAEEQAIVILACGRPHVATGSHVRGLRLALGGRLAGPLRAGRASAGGRGQRRCEQEAPDHRFGRPWKGAASSTTGSSSRTTPPRRGTATTRAIRPLRPNILPSAPTCQTHPTSATRPTCEAARPTRPTWPARPTRPTGLTRPTRPHPT